MDIVRSRTKATEFSLVDKRTVQQPKVQQLQSTGFQDPQAAAETSGT